MTTGFRDLGVLLAIILTAFVSAAGLTAGMAPGTAHAQQSNGQPAEAENFEQVALTDAMVKGYIAASPKLSELFDRMDNTEGKTDSNLDGELEALAKKHGFKSYDEMEKVGSNIGFVMSGINEEDGSFREPLEVLQEELADVEADASLAKEEKEQLVASIKESIALTPKLKFPGNVDVVKAHLKALLDLFQ
jgi:hypothetical protein